MELLKEMARQRYHQGYTPLENYYLQLYNEMEYCNCAKRMINLLERLPKVSDFYINVLGVDIAQTMEPFNPIKPKEENDAQLNQPKPEPIMYGVNQLGLYDVTDVQGTVDHAEEDSDDMFSDVSSESVESEEE